MKFSFKCLLNLRGSKDIHVPLLSEVESPNIIEPSHMVLVLMGKQNRIKRLNVRPEHLLAKIRPCIHDKRLRSLSSMVPIHLEKDTRTKPFIPDIIRGTHLAFAGNDRNPL